MYTDLVFPKGNEQKLLAMAQQLGITTVLLCYPLTDPYIKDRAKEVAKLEGAEFAVFVKTPKEIQKAKQFTKHIVARGRPGIYEDKRVKYVIDFESGTRGDFIHHRNAGLTQVMVKQVIRTGKTFFVNIHQLLSGEKHIILGRMQQNNTLFKKYKPNVLVVSGATTPLEMRAPKDLENVLTL